MSDGTSGAPWRPAAGWDFKHLRHPGHCKLCHRPTVSGEWGWHNPAAPLGHRVVCSDCCPRPNRPSSLDRDGSAIVVGGSSTLRDSGTKRYPTRWRKGATGEYIMYERLTRELRNGERIFPSLSLPGRPSDIDSLVVASSGVWVLDAKRWSGRIKYGSKSLFHFDTRSRLYVDGVDHTSDIAKIDEAVIPIAEIIGDPSVPIHRAWALVYADWAMPHVFRFLLGMKPIRHEGVWLGPPGTLCRLIKEPGPLSQEQIDALADRFQNSLNPR